MWLLSLSGLNLPCLVLNPHLFDTNPDSFLCISSLDKFMSKNEGSLSPSAFGVHLNRCPEGLPPLASGFLRGGPWWGRDGLIKNLWESIFMKSQSSCTILLQPYCPSFLPSYMVSSSISDGCFLCVCSAFTSLYNCSCFSFRFHMKNFLREFFADHSNLILSVPHFLGGSFFTVLVTI